MLGLPLALCRGHLAELLFAHRLRHLLRSAFQFSGALFAALGGKGGSRRLLLGFLLRGHSDHSAEGDDEVQPPTAIRVPTLRKDSLVIPSAQDRKGNLLTKEGRAPLVVRETTGTACRIKRILVTSALRVSAQQPLGAELVPAGKGWRLAIRRSAVYIAWPRSNLPGPDKSGLRHGAPTLLGAPCRILLPPDCRQIAIEN